MNLSGKSVAAMAGFYKIAPEEMLIAHDELDIAAGTARFKQGGGHGGHNGLRDIVPALGKNANFHRLRIGIGHPGEAAKVTGYVLGKPTPEDRTRIDASIAEAIAALPLLLDGRDGTGAEAARRFADLLGEATGLPVELQDERLTTAQAERALREAPARRRRGRKQVVDAMAATLLLRTYLERTGPAT